MPEPAEIRERELARRTVAPLGSPFTAKVVGVSFVPAHPDNLYALDVAQQEAQVQGEPLVVILVRNPANAYDPNAVEVHVPALGEQWAMIGHLTRPIVARLAPELDAGACWAAQVESVLIHPEHLDNPGVSIRCARQEEQNG